MKKFSFALLTLCAICLCACNNKKEAAVVEEQEVASNVYFTANITPEAVMQLFEYVKDSIQGNVGLKVHFGEDGNQNFVPASMCELLCKELNATLIETNVAYNGRRNQTETHLELAKDHGFTFAPIDILDAGGTLVVPVDGGHRFDSAYLGKNLEKYETIVYFTHFKGHGTSGFGGCIKNASMGMATPRGKEIMHSNNFPIVNAEACTSCSSCLSECPANAISLNPLRIDYSKCIGCGKCVSTCPRGAIVAPNDEQQVNAFLEGLVEYAQAALKNHHNVYFSVVMNVSPLCDCNGNAPAPICGNIGILASTDIVAIEAAAHDLVDKATNSDDAFLKANSISGKHQIEYAEKMGLGHRKYNLVNIDEK